jgi:GT2 family glycosyltransferase/GNAT superfamily N-acetyltransferase
MSFSVLICTYNRPELLARSLAALIDGTTEKPDQVVVVNGGDERADRVVEGFIGRHGLEVKLVKTVNKNLAASRNVGLPHCTGDLIAMTDDDAEVFSDWVTQMKRAHAEHPEAGAVGGAVIGADSEHSLLSRLADVATFPSPPQPAYVRTLPGVNISYKRDAIEQIGPQDETLFRGEDVDYNWRVQKLGYKVYYDPAIKVLHHHRPTLRQFLDQYYMYGRAYYLVRRKWPEMYCVYPHQRRRPKDLLRALNFVAGAIYEPLLVAVRLKRWSDQVVAYPLLLMGTLAWRTGIIKQFLVCRWQGSLDEQMASRRFVEELDEYLLLKLTLDDYIPSTRALPPGYKLADASIRPRIRQQERKCLQYYFPDWDIPYCGKFPGWREDSPIYVLHGGELVAGVYLCDRNAFDDDPLCGQLHYNFVSPQHRGCGIYSVVFREVVSRARAWGLQALYVNTDRYLLPEVYIRWGAVPVTKIRKQRGPGSYLPPAPRRVLRRLLTMARNWWKTYVIPPCK